LARLRFLEYYLYAFIASILATLISSLIWNWNYTTSIATMCLAR